MIARWKLDSIVLTVLLGALLANHQALHFIFAYLIWRFVEKARQFDTERLAREIVCGQSFFVLLYCAWLEFCGDTLLDYLPVMLYCLLSLVQKREESELMSAVDKNRQLKDNYLYLINNCQLYVLAYHFLEVFIATPGKGLVGTSILFFLMRTKYGFNPFLQKLFSNTHSSIMIALSAWKPLLTVYMLFYKLMGYIGKVYLQNGRRIQVGGPSVKRSQ